MKINKNQKIKKTRREDSLFPPQSKLITLNRVSKLKKYKRKVQS